MNMRETNAKSVTVSKDALLETLRTNLNNHVAQYNESVENYKNKVIALAKQNLKIANSRELDRIAKISFNIPVPISYADEYRRKIRMFEMSVDNHITLTEADFNQLVMDEFSWKSVFVGNSALYKS